jgi:hypothetical protein
MPDSRPPQGDPAPPVTPYRFARLLEAELLLRQAQFSLADLQEFVAAAWPLIVDDPDVQRWAREFLDSGQADVPT